MTIDYGNASEKNMLVDEGAVYIGDFTDVQATKGYVEALKDKVLGYFEDKLTINIKPKIDVIKNAAKKVKGWQRVSEWDVKITGDLLDLNEKLIESSLLDKVGEGHYVASYGIIAEEKYKDVLVVGENKSGDPTIILIRDVFNKEGIKFDMKGKENASFKISLENAYDGKIKPVEVFSNFTQMVKSKNE
ncbi:hypothetical protein ACFO6R_08450 [Eubacterium multiforme]|uniref:Phage major tail protein, phi13 family n=1 Tax=Eubacterium multiforme TaxID=83339 RepID=A0ABT9UUM4_9FIRM|nr:hypothetical protein [Eubacterium multiforme]MDQ0150033.1 hypothetical protein [Eubacterium multiforme]